MPNSERIIGDPRRNPSWEEILASDPDHEKHLETAEGRFQAILNIIKTGGMVLEVMAMDETYRDSYDISKSVNDNCGWRVNKSSVTQSHLIQTVGAVGAAARSDIDENDWKLTPFGQTIKPVLIYVWQKILEGDFNPAKALASISRVKKDTDGNLVTTPPYTRAEILLELAAQGQMTEAELIRKERLNHRSIGGHLIGLKEGGLVNYESVNSGDSFAFFAVTDKGKALAKWPTYRKLRGRYQPKLSQNADLAITALVLEGKETFTTSNVVNWVRANINDPGSAKHRSVVTSVLNFLCREGLLEKGDLNGDNMSAAALTDQGRFFVDKVLKPLYEWAQDPNSVPEINTVREKLRINKDAYRDLNRDIARLYQDTSPFKNRDRDAKRISIVTIVDQNPGKYTFSSLARKLQVSRKTISLIIQPLIGSGRIMAEHAAKGNFRYLFPGEVSW